LAIRAVGQTWGADDRRIMPWTSQSKAA
jgi:hypothetical protein